MAALDKIFTKNKTEILIALVQELPVIWNKDAEGHGLHTLRRSLWEGIAHDLGGPSKGFTAKLCDKKWKGLRDTFRQKCKELKGKMGQEAKRIRAWRWYKQLLWLVPYLGIRE